MKTASEIQSDLAQCTGSEGYYKHFSGLLYTGGVATLAESAECYWLIDVIASHQTSQVKRDCNGFQLWEIVVNKSSATVSCRRDSNEQAVVNQWIEYTDFPLLSQKFYLCNGVLMLPSEY